MEPLRDPEKTAASEVTDRLPRNFTAVALAVAGITKRFTLHGLRYTFTDLVRLANVDAVVRRALTGHVTEEKPIGDLKLVSDRETEPAILGRASGIP